MNEQQIGEAIAVILAVSIVLGRILGPVVMYLTESIKATGLIPDGYAGILNMVLSVLLAIPLMILADGLTPTNQPTWVLVMLGAVSGAVAASDAVRSYKAVGDVNTKGAATTIVQNAPDQQTGVQIGADDAGRKVQVNQEPQGLRVRQEASPQRRVVGGGSQAQGR